MCDRITLWSGNDVLYFPVANIWSVRSVAIFFFSGSWHYTFVTNILKI